MPEIRTTGKLREQDLPLRHNGDGVSGEIISWLGYSDEADKHIRHGERTDGWFVQHPESWFSEQDYEGL